MDNAKKQPVRPTPALQCTKTGPGFFKFSSYLRVASTCFINCIKAFGFSGRL
jgi:hypothetical protein